MKKSFKSLLAVIMLFSATLSANAQFSKKESNRVPDRFHMGLRAGATLNSYNNGTDVLPFPYGGLGVDFQVAPIPIFVETGLYFINKGYPSDGDYKSDDDEKYDSYINMPILASYHLNLAPNLFLQPFVGGVVGYLTESEEFDASVRIGVGLNFGRLYVNLGYDIGITEHDYKEHSHVNTSTNSTLFMTIGFNWAGSR